MWKNCRHGHRVIQRINAEAERNGDMRVADLRGIDHLRLFAPAVIKRQHRVGQHHQPAAQPAEMFRADEAGVDVRNPVHQPVGADVNAIGADGQQRQVHRQHPAKAICPARTLFLSTSKTWKHCQNKNSPTSTSPSLKSSWPLRPIAQTAPVKNSTASSVSSSDSRLSSCVLPPALAFFRRSGFFFAGRSSCPR